MFCPRCGSNQSEELRFCKGCGANLYAVRQVIDTRETEEKFDWSKTWLAEALLTGDEKRQTRIERMRGITPEVKRYEEIKAGVITSSVGIALSIFLWVFMEGIVRSGNVSPGAIQILNHIWIAGVIPVFVGMALMINGLVVSKRLVEVQKRAQEGTNELPGQETPSQLRPANTSEFIPSRVSVTEHTTKHLKTSGEQ